MVTSEANICMFCGRAVGSDEHVFADWITDVLPGEGPFTSSGSGKRTKESSRLAVMTRSVCIDCNTTWMSQMESDTKPLITPAILGNAVSWSREDQHAIAVWATKTALTADSSYPTRYAPEGHARFLYEAAPRRGHCRVRCSAAARRMRTARWIGARPPIGLSLLKGQSWPSQTSRKATRTAPRLRRTPG